MKEEINLLTKITVGTIVFYCIIGIIFNIPETVSIIFFGAVIAVFAWFMLGYLLR